jgi:putative methionine-R-sulfoxide reductase with GAF domain
LTNSKELLEADRLSLLAFDEVSNELILRAAIGLSVEPSEVSRLRLGEGISGGVLKSEKPLVVQNIEEGGFESASAQRNYKTKSFISYLLTIGGRKIGVLNATDKSSGGNFDEVDLNVLEPAGGCSSRAIPRYRH